MKKIQNIILTLLLVTSAGLNALDVHWSVQLPVGASIDTTKSGSDGSAIAFDRNTDTLYWVGSSGSLVATIENFTNSQPFNLDNVTYVSSSLAIIPLYSSPTWQTKVITKTESSYSIETLQGTPDSFEVATSAPFFSITNGNEIKQYRITELSPPSTIQSIPANAIVIPALYQGNVSVTLESSVDLVDWSPVLPGTFSGQDDARFFRVKAVAQD